MAKQGAKTATPRLRFPEFRNGPPWRTYLLEELEVLAWIELGRGNVISNQDIQKIPGNFPIYSSSVKNDGYMGSYGRFMFDEELISWSIDGGGDFFYRPKHKFSVTNVSGYMRLVADHLNYRFTATQLQSLHSSQVFDYQLKAHPSVIRKLYRLAVPDKAEQQKIADCLTSLDEVIAAQGRKVEALKAHKRGLMQQLFPREGETRPRLRFPEFRDAPEWKWTTLNRVCDMQAGKFVSASEISDEPGEGTYSCYGGNGLRGFTKSFTHSGVFPLIGRQGALCGNVQFAKGEFHATEHALVATPQAGVNVTWLYYTLGKLELNKYATGQAQPGLSIDVLKSVECSIPATEIEQQRIADCLASLDTQITAESNQLAALKTHKQGLMQQLFPAPEAT